MLIISSDRKRILYVEDNEDTANAVRIILSNAGFDVDLAFCGGDGLAKCKTASYDLILLDVMLPDMSGWEVYERLRKNFPVKYAFLSAIPISQERLDQIGREGISDYILKPVTKADLLKRIGKIV